jgi:heme-degrading monooxygenase HmoA
MTAYTLAMWKVKEGSEEEFVRRWRDELAPFFISLSPGAQGTLVRSIDDPSLFYSFGPWKDLDAIAEMRSNPRTPEAIGRLTELCTEATPGTYDLVLKIPP